MKRSVLVAVLLASTLAACAKKEEAAVVLPAPATAPSLAIPPAAVVEAPAPATPEAAKPAGEDKPAQ